MPFHAPWILVDLTFFLHFFHEFVTFVLHTSILKKQERREMDEK